MLVTSTPNPAGAGEPVTFDITVTSETGVVPAGAVYLAVDNVFIDAASLENGHAAMIWSSLTPGTHTVDAYFEPESADFIGTVSALEGGVTVTAGLSQTVVTSLPNPSELNGTVVFTAGVTPIAPATGLASGTVEFFDGATSMGAPIVLNASGNATLSVSTLTGGVHPITAKFVSTDPATLADSTSAVYEQTVNRAPSATTLQVLPTSPVHGEAVTLTAGVVSFAGTPTGTVEFFDGATSLGTGTLDAGSASIITSTLPTGTRSLTAVYAGDVNFLGSTSGTVTLNVGKSATATVVVSGSNPSVFGEPVTFSANVAAVLPGVGVPTGSVQFVVNGIASGAPVALDGSGNASSAPIVPEFLGANSVDAVYSGDGDFVTSTGSVVQTLNQGSTSSQVSSAPNPSLFGESVTITATVAAVAPASGIPSGNVTFLDGGVPIGTAALASGSASMTTATLAVGSHSLSVAYAGDFTFSASTSATTDQVVNTAGTATVLTSSPNPSIFSNPVTLNAAVSAVAPATGIPAGSVEFLDGTTSLGVVPVDAAGNATLNVSTLTGGCHSLSANFTSADANVFGNSISNLVDQTVEHR